MTFQGGNRRAAKLTGEQVMVIRERYATERGCTQARLSREYQVSIGTIANIVNGLTWQTLYGGATPVDRPPTYAPQVREPDEETLKARMLARLAEPQAKFVIPPLEDDTNSAVLDKLTRDIARETAPDTALGELLDGGQKGDST